jgi:serine/threonine protein kinase
VKPGDFVGKYALVDKIGSGSMGDVYEAITGDQRVALKIHKLADKTLEARFLREAKTMAMFRHPNIVELVEVGKLEDGQLFFAAELVRGVTLRSAIDERPMDRVRALTIVRQVLSALGHAHGMGVVHRDIKPENVMLAEGDQVKILDFGVAKLLGDTPAVLGEGTLTIAGYGQLGTPYYMSPEAVLGLALDGRADLYSIGAMLYEMLTGKPPYEHEDVAVLMRMHAAAPIPKLDAATPELALVIAESMAKEPTSRFKSAAEMITAVDAAIRSVEAPTEVAGSATRVKQRTDVFGTLPMKRPAEPVMMSQPPQYASGPVVGVVVPASGRPSGPMFAPPMPQPMPPPPKHTNKWLVLAREHKKPVFVVAGALAVLLVVVIVVAARGGSKKPAAKTTTVPKHAELVHGAQELIAANHPDKAAELLEREELGNDAELLVVLGHARIGAGRRLDGLAAYERALLLDRKYASDAQLRGNVARVLDSKDAVAGVIALEMALRLDPPGHALIKQLASSSKIPDLRRRAFAVAERENIADGIDRVDSYSLDLAQATTCEDRLAAVLKLRSTNDARAIPALKKAKQIKCVEAAVVEAIAYLDSRPPAPQP